MKVREIGKCLGWWIEFSLKEIDFELIVESVRCLCGESLLLIIDEWMGYFKEGIF